MALFRYREWRQGEFCLCFVDMAVGGGDYCAGQFLSHKWLDVPTVYHDSVTGSMATPIIHDELTRISAITGVPPVVAFERNNGGAFEMDRLARLNRFGAYKIYTMKVIGSYGSVVDSGKLGWDTNSGTRPKMVQELKDAVESHVIHLYHRQTVNELFSFIKRPNGRPEAEVNAHDDLVMALAGVWQLYQTEQPPRLDEGGASGVIETVSQAPGQYKDAFVLDARSRFEE